jgi:hypothetical protein
MAAAALLGMVEQTSPGGGVGLYPLIILVLVAAWGGFLACAVLTLARLGRARVPGGRAALAAALLSFLAAVAAGVVLSPEPPVLSTYTGLAHVVSSYRIADLEWSWSFPTDYPLAVQVLAAFFVKIGGHTPAMFGLANSFLSGLGAAGVSLLAWTLFGSLPLAWFCGLSAALCPLTILLAGSDALVVGYYASSVWAILFLLGTGVRGRGQETVAPAAIPSTALRAGDDPPSPDASAGLRRPSTIASACSSAPSCGGAMETLAGSVGLACSLLVAVQCRLEAMAFLPVVLAAFFLLGAPGELARSARRISLPALGFAVAAVPYLALFHDQFIATGRAGEELGFQMVRKVGAVTLFGLAAVLFAAYGRPASAPAGLKGRGIVASLLLLTFSGLTLIFWGPEFYSFDPVCFGPSCQDVTFRTILAWHLNPKLVPVGLGLLFIVGLTASSGRNEARVAAFLLVWLGVVVGIASTKATGELPFEGARTQLPATVPFLLFAGLGARLVASALPPTFWVRGAVFAVLLGPPYPRCLSNATGSDWDQQAEYRFLESCLPRLPERSILYAPDDEVVTRAPEDSQGIAVDLYTLHRTGFLAEALRELSRATRFAPLSTLDEADARGRRFFFLGMSCYRTGGEGIAPSCRRLEGMRGLSPVCEATVRASTHTSDFYTATRIAVDEVKLGVYELPGADGRDVPEEAEHAVP